jgi:hypothetical protein
MKKLKFFQTEGGISEQIALPPDTIIGGKKGGK